MKNPTPSELTWVSLGGNRGPVHETFDRVTQALEALSIIPLMKSPRYWSDPWGEEEQPRFLNQVIGLDVDLGPTDMMAQLHLIEAEHGRDRTQETRWGPRTVDLDLLCWPDQAGTLGKLYLPHPRLHLRRFVLQPWSDVAPHLTPYGLTDTVERLLERCTDTGSIERC